MGPNVRTTLPFHRRPSAMMANSVAETAAVYNKEADIALPITRSGFDRTSTEQKRE
jgi:hypothetical protein